MSRWLYRIGFWRLVIRVTGWLGPRLDGLHAGLHREPDRDCLRCQQVVDEVVAEYMRERFGSR